MQIEMEFQDSQELLLVSNMEVGKPFRFKHQRQDIHIRVKATGFLLNSNVISDVINRGDILVCNLQKGTVYAVEGDRQVERVDASIKIKKVR